MLTTQQQTQQHFTISINKIMSNGVRNGSVFCNSNGMHFIRKLQFVICICGYFLLHIKI